MLRRRQPLQTSAATDLQPLQTSAATIVSLIYLLWFGVLVSGRLKVTRRKAAFTPIAALVFMLARLAIAGTIWPMATFEILHSSVPVTAFVLLLVSETVGLLFSAVGPSSAFAYLRVPSMTVHFTTLLYYLWEPDRIGALTDAFGHPLSPLRYVMWTTSVSLMIFSIYYLVEAVLSHPVTGGLPWRPSDARELHRQLIQTLLAALGTFWFGFFGSFDWRHQFTYALGEPPAPVVALIPNVVNFSLSTASFYIMLCNLNQMLVRAQNHPLLLVSGVFRQVKSRTLRLIATRLRHAYGTLATRLRHACDTLLDLSSADATRSICHLRRLAHLPHSLAPCALAVQNLFRSTCAHSVARFSQ